jgi:chromate reductase, NAD(P)H dehydrogenase (quinone)
MTITIVASSPRKNSNSLRFATYLKNVLTDLGHDDIRLIDFAQYDIPFVGTGSVHPDTLTPFQQAFTSAWEAADLVIFAIPEYNWTTTPQFDNAIHQLGGQAFKHLFNNKVFAFVGVSSGRGGRQPALDATTVVNKMISFSNSYSVVSPKIYESHETAVNLDENGHFHGHEIYAKTVRAFAEYSVNIAQRWAAASLVDVK